MKDSQIHFDCPSLLTFEQEIFQLVLGMAMALDVGQLDIVHIVDGLDRLHQPVVRDVIVHRENGLLGKARESGHRSGREFAVGRELKFGLQNGSGERFDLWITKFQSYGSLKNHL